MDRGAWRATVHGVTESDTIEYGTVKVRSVYVRNLLSFLLFFFLFFPLFLSGNKTHILWQGKKNLNIKILPCPLGSALPPLCNTYLHYELTKPPPLTGIPAQP